MEKTFIDLETSNVIQSGHFFWSYICNTVKAKFGHFGTERITF
jgi:hypothetical protein